MKYLRIAMLVLGMVMVTGGAGLFVKNYMRTAETRNWPRAQARVTESRVDTLHATEVGNAGDFMPHVRYDYVVQGRTFHGDTLWLDEHRSFGSANVAARELAFLEAGTETEVLYNPQNPAEAALMVDKPSWRYFFLALPAWIYEKLRGIPEAMGRGDFTLMALLGAWFGWSAILPIVLLSSCVAVAVSLPLMAAGKRDLASKIPFGPYIAGAGVIYLFFGTALKNLIDLPF